MSGVRGGLWRVARAGARAANALGVRGLYDLPGGRTVLVPDLRGGRLRATGLGAGDDAPVRYLSAPPSSVAPSPLFAGIYRDELLPRPHRGPVSVSGGRIVGRDGALLEPSSGRVFIESVCSRTSQLEKLRELAGLRVLERTRHEEGPLVFLPTLGSANYFQFVTDVLLRLHAFAGDGAASLASFRDAVAGIEFLVDAAAPAWQGELTGLLGLATRAVPLTRRSNLEVERLLVLPCPTFKPDGTHVTLFAPDAARWLGNVLREAAGAASTGAGRRLYLTRRGTSWRRLTNESAIEEVLRGRGFEVVAPEQLSVSEQIRLFADAEIVVAPHGSALTNIVFSRACTVVELVSPSYPSGVFYALADALGHRYWYVVAEPAEDERSFDHACDPEQVARTLDAALRP